MQDVEKYDGSIVLRFSAWDFTGQEIYYPTNQFFQSGRSLFVIVFKLTDESTSRIEYWLNTVQSRSKDANIVLVGTHADQITNQNCDIMLKSVREKYAHRFPNIREIVGVSCLNFYGINDIKERVIRIAMNDRMMREVVPASYLNLARLVERERISKYSNSPMTYDEFERIVISESFPTEDVQMAIQFLIDVGVILHNDDPAFLGPSRITGLVEEEKSQSNNTIQFTQSIVSDEDGISDNRR